MLSGSLDPYSGHLMAVSCDLASCSRHSIQANVGQSFKSARLMRGRSFSDTIGLRGDNEFMIIGWEEDMATYMSNGKPQGLSLENLH